MQLTHGLALGLLSSASTAVASQLRCGTGSASFALRSLSEDSLKQNKRAQADREPITVKTYLHVVADDETVPGGYYGDEIIEREMQVLNDAFATHGFIFDLIETTRTVNDNWTFPHSSPGGPSTEPEMRQALKKGGYGDLNIFFTPHMIPGGMCELPLPDPSSDEILMDGCLVKAQNLEEGDITEPFFNNVIIHEVGHWLGLLHTFDAVDFDNGCEGPGDFVDDTPAESHPYTGDGDECPVEGRDTCPDLPGLDPVDNYMTYAKFGCKEEIFTPGQVDRMHNLWHELRAPFLCKRTN